MPTPYPLKVQAIRPQGTTPRLYVYFPIPWPPPSVWKPANRSSGNCSTAANCTWSAWTRLCPLQKSALLSGLNWSGVLQRNQK